MWSYASIVHDILYGKWILICASSLLDILNKTMLETGTFEVKKEDQLQLLQIPNHYGNDNDAEHQIQDDSDTGFSKLFIPLRSSSSKSQSKESPSYNLGSMKRKIYASTISPESIYKKHKHEQSWKWKVFRRSFGIPLAILYYKI